MRTRSSIQGKTELFMEATGADLEEARLFLGATEWALNAAIMNYFENQRRVNERPSFRHFMNIGEVNEDPRGISSRIYNGIKRQIMSMQVNPPLEFENQIQHDVTDEHVYEELKSDNAMVDFEKNLKKASKHNKWLMLVLIDESMQSYGIIKDIFPALNSNEIFTNNFLVMKNITSVENACPMAQLYGVEKFPSILVIDSVTNEKLIKFNRISPLEDFIVLVIDFLATHDFPTMYPRYNARLFENESLLLNHTRKRNQDMDVIEVSPQANLPKRRKIFAEKTVNGLCESLADKTLGDKTSKSDDAIIIEEKGYPIDIQLICKLPDGSRKVLKFEKDARVENLKAELLELGFDQVCVNTRPSGPSLLNFNPQTRLYKICKNNTIIYITSIDE